METLNALLQSLRLTSAFLSLARLRGSFCVDGNPVPGKMIFHGIASGECYVRRHADGDTRHLVPGDVVILTAGDEHSLLADPRNTSGTLITELPATRVGTTIVVHQGSTGAETRVVCGTFELHHPAHRYVVDLLPRVLVCKPEKESARRWAQATVSLIEEGLLESGITVQTAALADSIFVHALTQAADSKTRPSSLLAAVRDERIGKALARIHAEPHKRWSVEKLAKEAAMSRTRFFDRFTELVGEAPATYMTRWRALVAADLLKHKSMSVHEVAQQVGYTDEDALAKAFKRHLGMSPSEYRRSAVVN